MQPFTCMSRGTYQAAGDLAKPGPVIPSGTSFRIRGPVMFEERSHWVSLISGIGAIYLWTLFGIYGTVGIIGIIIAFIVGGMVGSMVWAGANRLTNDWFDDTHTLPGVFIGFVLSLLAGFGIEASGVLPGVFFYVLGAGVLLGLAIGLRMDAKGRHD